MVVGVQTPMNGVEGGMGERLRRAAADAAKGTGGLIAAGLNTTLGSRARGTFGILYYHRIADQPRGMTPPSLNVTPARFRMQVRSLLERGFRILSVGSVLDLIEGREEIPLRTAVLTFDDGFRGVYQHAWPILRELGVPATVFLATAFMGSGQPFPFDRWGRRFAGATPSEAWRPLTWEDCKAMAEDGAIEFGTHTHTHTDMRDDPGRFSNDLKESLAVIEERLGISTSILSFPFGNVHKGFANDRMVQAAKRSGIRCGLTTEMALVDSGTSPFRWGRFEASQSDSGPTLQAKLDGWYTWMETGRRMFQGVVGSQGRRT